MNSAMKIQLSVIEQKGLEAVGIRRQTLRNWMSGRITPSRTSAYILTQITGRDYIKRLYGPTSGIESPKDIGGAAVN